MKHFLVAFVLAVTVTSAISQAVSADGGCDGTLTATTVTELSFDNAEVRDEENTLHEVGGQLRYRNVGEVESEMVDLVVTDTKGDYHEIVDLWNERNKTNVNGIKAGSKFGVINLQTEKNVADSGEGNFRFCIVESGTDDEVVVEQFSFSVYDLDNRADSAAHDLGKKQREKVAIDMGQAQAYRLDQNSELEVGCEDLQDPPCEAGVRTVFYATEKGGGDDNPIDPNSLNATQLARTVVFTFSNTACWEITFNHYCPVEQDYWKTLFPQSTATHCGNKYTGGNLLFAGNSDQIINDGTCVTSPPTMSPSSAPSLSRSPSQPPSQDPTASSDLPSTTPSDQPSISPTATLSDQPSTPPTLFPTTAPVCTEDVTLFSKEGTTEVDLLEAVRILDQNTTTVTVRLYQAWTSESEAVDSIFYTYRESSFKETCYEEEDVQGTTDYKDITIQCYSSQPVALLGICVADSGGALSVSEDTATVPDCCHPDLPGLPPVVCYKIIVRCDSLCVDAVQRRTLRGAAE